MSAAQDGADPHPDLRRVATGHDGAGRFHIT